MTRGKKINNEIIELIITDFAISNNYNQTAKKAGVSVNTVKKVIKTEKEKNPDEFNKKQEDTKKEFHEKAKDIIFDYLDILKQKIEMINTSEDQLKLAVADIVKDRKLSNKKKNELISEQIAKQTSSLSGITNAMSSLYDKMRLDKNESTSNVAFSFENLIGGDDQSGY